MINYNYEDESERYTHIENDTNVMEVLNHYGNFLLKKVSYVANEEIGEYPYYELVNYNTEDDVDTLNLTWMDPDDVINLVKNGQNQFIKNIIVNIDNLAYSTIPTEDYMFSDVDLVVVNNENSKLNPIRKFKDLMSFIETNAKALNSITVKNAPKLVSDIANKKLESFKKEIETKKIV